MAGNVSIDTDAADNWKPSKKKSVERIGGVVALIMALDRATCAGNHVTWRFHVVVSSVGGCSVGTAKTFWRSAIAVCLASRESWRQFDAVDKSASSGSTVSWR